MANQNQGVVQCIMFKDIFQVLARRKTHIPVG
jgi:hypothetical protein